MKKRGVLQAELSRVIADAGLPAPSGAPCIDLAVRCGLPAMLEVTRAVAEELQVEEVTIADELVARDEALSESLRELFSGVRLSHVSHDELKRMSERARDIVRTEACTPYANVVLASGVTF